MDSKEKFGCYIHKDRKVINAIYILGKYFDPELVTLQIERLAALATAGLGIGAIIIIAFLH